jgi:hypothetical protein
MPTEKDIALVDYLLRSTQAGKTKWEPTARANEFTASVRGKYNVVIGLRHEREGWETVDHYVLIITDEQERELVNLTDYGPVHDLYELARRASLNVDAAIDDIIAEEI